LPCGARPKAATAGGPSDGERRQPLACFLPQSSTDAARGRPWPPPLVGLPAVARGAFHNGLHCPDFLWATLFASFSGVYTRHYCRTRTVTVKLLSSCQSSPRSAQPFKPTVAGLRPKQLRVNHPQRSWGGREFLVCDGRISSALALSLTSRGSARSADETARAREREEVGGGGARGLGGAQRDPGAGR
jgi:hypothetical protein